MARRTLIHRFALPLHTRALATQPCPQPERESGHARLPHNAKNTFSLENIFPTRNGKAFSPLPTCVYVPTAR